MTQQFKIVLPGGAGLVGQNLVARLKALGYEDIVVIDKHRRNLEILKKVQPDVTVEYADLADPGAWETHLVGAHVVVMLQAQIGGNNYQDFVRNNVESTRRVLDAIKLYKVRLLHPFKNCAGAVGVGQRGAVPGVTPHIDVWLV